jgi:hypothetical protein
MEEVVWHGTTDSRGCTTKVSRRMSGVFDNVHVFNNANGRLTDYKSYRLVGLICPDNMLLH